MAYRCDGHEFEQAPGIGDGQESQVCCSPWGRTESDTTEVTQQQQQHDVDNKLDLKPNALTG